MNYQVLARKWRPKTFSDVVGQKHVLTTLANGLSLRRIHHAYLFSGARGVGKTSIARLLAKGMVCEIGITATPCNMCDNCRNIEQGRLVDLIEIDAASRTKVEDTRSILDSTQYVPSRSRFKVYLIDEVHMLSRYSFNALLKTLEEPPEHVKFLMATTDPQKLPATILSRCLRFHLKALDVNQIYDQLEHILDTENIFYEPRALKILAVAADGSLRDALSLADQAIANGNGKLKAESVSTMLGTLDSDQALSLIEAVINADGKRTLSLVNVAAAHGVEWETLLVEMLAILHRVAMLQLSSSAISIDMETIEHRLRDLARTVPPADVQLYYQTLLIGRKELLFAPNRRMGVEMTLLRALAFHPNTPLLKPKSSHQSSSSVVPSELMSKQDIPLSDVTSSVLTARGQLQQCAQEIEKLKSSKLLEPNKARPINNSLLKQLESTKKYTKSCSVPSAIEKKDLPWKEETIAKNTEVEVESLKNLKKKKAPRYKKSPELEEKLTEEVSRRDAWAAEINQLHLPKLVKQVALNSWKEQNGNQICLHLRPNQQYFNFSKVQKTLEEAFTMLQGTEIELTIIEDDNFSIHTPMEWRQVIYEEKLTMAREAIIKDDNIRTLRLLFNAHLDEESIRPI